MSQANLEMLFKESVPDFIHDQSEFLQYHSAQPPTDYEAFIDEGEYNAFVEVANLSANTKSVANTVLAPYRFICKLLIHRFDGKVFGGTGVLISNRHVLTAGHCILPTNSNQAAKSITVLPGASAQSLPFGGQVSQVFNVSNPWRKRRNNMFDYGIITLPDLTLFNRVKGHFLLTQPTQKKAVLGGGYLDMKPVGAEGPKGHQFTTTGHILDIYKNSIYFTNDLKAGYSGGPIYSTIKKNNLLYFQLYGLGCYKHKKNFGPRVNNKMMKEISKMVSK